MPAAKPTVEAASQPKVVHSCTRHFYTVTLPAEARRHRDHKTLAPLRLWGIWTRRKCGKCGAITEGWAKLRYEPTSRREAWDAFRPER